MKKDLETELQQIGQEHAHLHTLFGALECTVDRGAALIAIAELEQWLERHFEREEREGGLLEEIPESEADEVAALRREHVAIKSVLSETRSLLRACQDPEAELVREATAILGASLRAHEKREMALFDRAMPVSK